MNHHEPFMPFMRRREVAKLLKVSGSTVSRLVERGDLEAFRIGGRLRISTRSIEKFTGFPLDDRRCAVGDPS